MSWTARTLEVKRSDWSEVRVVEQNLTPPDADQEVVFDVGRLALTSNNIYYAFNLLCINLEGILCVTPGISRLRLSILNTLYPLATNSSQTLLPMNPLPPVTTIAFSSLFMFFSNYFIQCLATEEVFL